MKKTSKILLSAFIIVAVVCSFSIVHADLIDPGTRHTSNDYLDEAEIGEVPEEAEIAEVPEEAENVVTEQHSELISTLEDEVEGEEPHDELIAPHDESIEEGALIGPNESEAGEEQFSSVNRMALIGVCAVVVVGIIIFCATRGKEVVPPPVEEPAFGSKPEEPAEETKEEEAKEEKNEEN
ncbi:MAG: hypothetical protein IKN74_02385 [Clostridia bacterium]|nr:hypothetical protein [Clostridia bacterium]